MTLLVFAVPAATAAPIVIEMQGIGYVDGDPEPLPLSMTLTVESAQPDEDATAGDYLATGHGDAVLEVVLPPSTPIQLLDVANLIATDFGAGTWTMEAEFFVSTISIPMQIVFTGVGLSPDQILPDFTSITSGTFTAGTEVLLGGPMSGTMSIVPEPTTALLLGLGLAGLAVRRRR